MRETDTCNRVMVKAEGRVFPPVPFGARGDLMPEAARAGGRCHDCNAVAGGFHHPGCDAEACPNCRGQIISCGCLAEDPGEETQ